MSLPVMVWVLAESEAKLGARLVLLTLAEHAHDDGTRAFPDVETLVRRTRLSERAVQYALRKLEDDGAIEQTGTTKSGTAIWRIVMDRGAKSAPPGVQNLRQRGAKSAPDPRTEPSSTSEEVLAATENRTNGARKRDPIWDALVEIFGDPPQGMGRGRWNAAAKSLRADAATPEQIAAAAERYPRVFAGAVMTPTAIAANWVTLSRARDGPRKTGWRFVRGSHGSTYVPDPEGTDTPPREYR